MIIELNNNKPVKSDNPPKKTRKELSLWFMGAFATVKGINVAAVTAEDEAMLRGLQLDVITVMDYLVKNNLLHPEMKGQ